jgi:hypothetical protein
MAESWSLPCGRAGAEGTHPAGSSVTFPTISGRRAEYIQLRRLMHYYAASLCTIMLPPSTSEFRRRLGCNESNVIDVEGVRECRRKGY